VNRLIEQCYAHLFFFFFSFQIFSPEIGGRTLYLEYLMVLINPFFWIWVSRLQLSRRVLLLSLVAVFFVPFYTVAAVKLVVVLIGVMFLVYCRERRVFFIKFYLFISIFIACLQLFLVISGQGGLARMLGPNHLASLVWGPYAVQTFTNFYTIFYIPRVSGLSREAGFFASFIVAAYFAVLLNRSLEQRPLSLRDHGFFAVGYVVSFSKISLALPPAVLIFWFRKLVDRIPLIFIGALFLAALTAFWNYFEAILFLKGNGTFLGRLGAYALIDNLNLHQLLFGVDDVSKIHGPLANLIASYGYKELFGTGGWFIANGAISYVLYMLALQLLGIRSTGFLFVLLMTATVGIDTNQNFCVLSYYVAFMLPKVHKFVLSRRRVAVQRAASHSFSHS
jgi:hypothetical protein